GVGRRYGLTGCLELTYPPVDDRLLAVRKRDPLLVGESEGASRCHDGGEREASRTAYKGSGKTHLGLLFAEPAAKCRRTFCGTSRESSWCRPSKARPEGLAGRGTVPRSGLTCATGLWTGLGRAACESLTGIADEFA